MAQPFLVQQWLMNQLKRMNLPIFWGNTPYWVSMAMLLRCLDPYSYIAHNILNYFKHVQYDKQSFEFDFCCQFVPNPGFGIKLEADGVVNNV
jgi:hypothetical protein